MKELRNFIGKIYDYINAYFQKLKYLFIIIKQNQDKNNYYEELKKLTNSQVMTLFITHNLGGGTEQYVNNYLKEHSNVIVVTNLMHKIDIVYKVWNPETGKSFFVMNFSKIFSIGFKNIILNSLVSYHNIPKIINSIIKFKKKFDCNVDYMIHDFHCICPKHNLIYKDFFCNFECKKNNCQFTNDYECTNISINKWRKVWKEFLLICDKIICFSSSSKEYIQKIYNLYDEKIKIVPHDMNYVSYSKIKFSSDMPLHLGIVGACGSIPKGKKEIEKLMNMLPAKIPVTFVGTSENEYDIKRENVFFLGRYKNGELQKQIEENKITVVFFPSVCPETFSYLISELMQMDIRIICYNFGAQAEKLSLYDKGFICNGVDDVFKLLMSLD
jgi:glycosyltransferase involved in cell wall biosynthesis